MDEETSNRDHKSHKSHKSKKASSHKEGGGESSHHHDRDEKSKKRHRHRDDGRDDDDGDKSRKHKHKRSKKKDETGEGMKVHDESDDEDVWVEKTFDPEEVCCLIPAIYAERLTRCPESCARYTNIEKSVSQVSCVRFWDKPSTNSTYRKLTKAG